MNSRTIVVVVESDAIGFLVIAMICFLLEIFSYLDTVGDTVDKNGRVLQNSTT